VPDLIDAELRRCVVRDEIELRDGVRRGREGQQIIGGLVVVHPVEDEVVRLLAVPIDERSCAARHVVTVVERGVIRMNAARRQQRQFNVVSRCQGNVRDRSGVDQGADLGRLGLHFRRLRSHLNGIVDGADLHLEIHTGSLIQHQRQVRLDRGSKTGRLHPDVIGPNGQAGEGEQPAVAGFSFENGAPIDIRGRHGSAFDHRAARIDDRAGDGRSYLLGSQWTADCLACGKHHQDTSAQRYASHTGLQLARG
jgi:hypothetical protein